MPTQAWAWHPTFRHRNALGAAGRENRDSAHGRAGRRGLTFIELVLATTILAFMAIGLAMLGAGAQRSFEHGEGYGNATQHARVAIERITRTISTATANETFPGVLVLSETEATWTFPNTLVVWHPQGTAANPTGLPLYQELAIYCSDPAAPNCLVEITVPGNTNVVPAYTDTTTWASSIAAITASSTCQKVTLTDLLRTATVLEGTGSEAIGAVQFVTRLIPSQTAWTQYTQGKTTWSQLGWAQGVGGSTTGLRQVWVRMEIQLMPYSDLSASSQSAMGAVPFFGSAALYYEMHK